MIIINKQLQNSNKKINIIVILNILGTFISHGLTFFLTPILTRALSTYNYGIISIYTTWVGFITPIFGLNPSTVIPSIKMYIDENKQMSWISSVAGMSVTSNLIFSGIVIIFLMPISKLLELPPFVIVMMCLHCFGSSIITYIVSYYIHYQKTIYQFAFNIIVSLLSAASTLILLYFITDFQYKYLAKIIGFAMSYFFVGIVALVVLILKGKKIIDLEVWKYALPLCIPIIFHAISHIILGQSDKIMIQMLLEDGVSLAGIYGFAHTLAGIGTILWTAFNNAWAPFYYGMLKTNNMKNVRLKSKNYLYLFTGVFVAFLLIIPELAFAMGGKNFMSSAYIIPVIHLGNYFIFLYSFAINFKMVNKMVKSVAIGTISAAVCNIILNYMFIPKFGMPAAAYTSLVSYFLLFLFHHITIPKDRIDYSFNWRFYLQGIIIMVLAIVLYIICFDYFVIRWVMAICLGTYFLIVIIKRKTIF